MIHEQNTKKSIMLAPTAMTNTETATGSLDTLGSDYALVEIALASEINTNAVGPTISVLSSDVDTGPFVTVVADRTAEDITAAKAVVYAFDMRKHKRFLKLSVTTATATNDDVTVSAIGSLSRNADHAGTSDIADVVVLP